MRNTARVIHPIPSFERKLESRFQPEEISDAMELSRGKLDSSFRWNDELVRLAAVKSGSKA